MTRFWIPVLGAALGAALAPSCVPEFQFQGDDLTDAGGGGSSGGTQMGECASDDDCSGARPRCDTATLRCERCLPENDNCPDNYYCNEAFVCRTGCKNDEECQTQLGSMVFSCQPDPDDAESRTCLGCTADSHCALGSVCSATTECVPGCNSIANCEDGWECCPGAMTADLGSCELTVIDVDNCGSCGNVCDLPENAAETTCVGGTCGFNCEAFYVDCDGMADNGCEVFTRDDEANCGDCDTPCAGTCVDGVCE